MFFTSVCLSVMKVEKFIYFVLYVVLFTFCTLYRKSCGPYLSYTALPSKIPQGPEITHG
jgi:hypothetical protein